MKASLKDQIDVWNEVYENTASKNVVEHINGIIFSNQSWKKRASKLERYVGVTKNHLTADDKTYINTVINEVEGHLKGRDISYSFEVEEKIRKTQEKLYSKEEQPKVIIEHEEKSLEEVWRKFVEAQKNTSSSLLEQVFEEHEGKRQIGPTDLDTLFKLREKKDKGLIKSITPYEQTGLFGRVRGYAHKKLVAGIAIGAVLIGSLWFGYHQYNKSIDLQQKNKSQYEQIAKFGDEKASLEKSVRGLHAEIANKNKGIEERDKLIGIYSESQGVLTDKLDDCTEKLENCNKYGRGLGAELKKLRGKITVTKKYEEMSKDTIEKLSKDLADLSRIIQPETKQQKELKETKVPEQQKYKELDESTIKKLSKDLADLSRIIFQYCPSTAHIGNRGIFPRGNMYSEHMLGCTEPVKYPGRKEGSSSRFAYQR